MLMTLKFDLDKLNLVLVQNKIFLLLTYFLVSFICLEGGCACGVYVHKYIHTERETLWQREENVANKLKNGGPNTVFSYAHKILLT